MGGGARLHVAFAAVLLACTVSACGTTNGVTFTDAGTDGGVDGGTGFAVGGTVTGLIGSGLVLEDNGSDDVSVPISGSFQFGETLVTGAAYAVTVKTQPSQPLQTCTVSGGSGVVGSADVSSIAVTCVTAPGFDVSGTVMGLQGKGLILQNNNGEPVSVSGDGPFMFLNQIQTSQTYSITVAAQPTSPYQVCTVANGDGTIAGAAVTDVLVTCVASKAFHIGGSISGLTGGGLVLQDNGIDDLTITKNGSFTFATPFQEDVPYTVSVKTQPSAPLQTCAVTSGSGIVGGSDVTTVAITCADNPSFTIGGTVAGLSGAGLKLQDNGGDDLPISSSGPFTFAHGVQGTLGYRVAVSAQPAGQFCAVTGGGEGTVGMANVTSVAVTCASTAFIPVRVVVSGLTGTGLVLQDNATDTMPIAANGTFAFTDQLAAGAAYSVAVLTQPSAPKQTCTVANPAGAASASGISLAVQCATNAYFSLSGTLSGLTGTGLIVTDGVGDSSALSANGVFSFPTQLQSGDSFHVSVAEQPSTPFQICTVTNAVGTVSGAAVSNIGVNCNTDPFWRVSGCVTGLNGNSVTLENNGTNDTVVTAPATDAGLPGILDAGTITSDNCPGVSFIFTTLLQTGQQYAISVKTAPTALACAVTSDAAGFIHEGPVKNVVVSCGTPLSYPVGGTVTGLDGTSVSLLDNRVDPLSVTQNGPFTFPTPRPVGTDYNVSIGLQDGGNAQPINPAQSCVVQYSNGVITDGGVSSVGVICFTRTFSVGGTVSGLPTGSTVTLQDNGFDNRSVTGAGDGSTAIPFTFGSLIPSGRGYSAAILSTTGSVSCSVTGATGKGTIPGAGANVTSVAVVCVPAFLVSGTISGDSGTGLQLTNSTTGEVLTIAKGATTFAFARAVTRTQGYAIAVTAQPTTNSLACSYSTGTTAASGNPTATVSGIGFACTPDTFAVGGTITGLPSSAQLTLQNNSADSTVVSGTGDGSSPTTFSFVTPVNSGAAYAAKISASTGPVSCAIAANGAGTVANAAVNNIQIACVPTFTVSGNISGLAATGMQLTLRTLAGTTLQTLNIASASSTFAFTSTVTQASGYSLVITQPTSSPKQACTFANGGSQASGNPTANVINVSVVCSSTFFTIGGSVTGLPAGTSVTLLDNGFDRLTVNGTASGSPTFTFASAVPSGQTYQVSSLGTTGLVACTLGSTAEGTASAAVTSVAVVCTTGYSIAGTLTGYTGSGLQLKNTATNEVISVAKGATTFKFNQAVSTTQGYAISVAAAPTGPSQACAAGTTGSPLTGNPTANVTDVSLACTVSGFIVGGTVASLPSGASVKLTIGMDTITVMGAGDGTSPVPFSFDMPIASNASYTVTAGATTGPVACSIASGATGTVAGANVTNVVVSCVTAYFIGGTLSLYTGTGLQLKNNTTGEVITLGQAAPTFSFATPVSTALGYSLSVAVAPTSPVQGCSFSLDTPSPAADKPTANVSNIAIICQTNSFAVGGTVTGLPTGASVKLLDNAFDQATVNGTGDGTTAIKFNFPTTITSGSAYSATVLSTTGVVVCAIASPSGTVGNAAVTSIAVTCAPSFTLAGILNGYTGSNLQLSSSTTGETITVAKGATTFAFTKPVSTAQGYAISVASAPTNPAQVCTAASAPTPATGNPSANITNITFNCSTVSFTVGGVVNGLTGTGLVLQNNGGDVLQFGVQTSTYPNFTFPTVVASGQSYTVSVKKQPIGQICSTSDNSGVQTGIGVVTNSNVTNVVITCGSGQRLGGVVTGYLGNGLTLTDGFESLPIASAGGANISFNFPTPLQPGQSYAAAIVAQGSAPLQTCTVTGGSSGNDDGTGTIMSSDDESLVVACGAPAYQLGGTIEGAANGTSDALAVQISDTNTGAPLQQLVISITAASTGVSFAFDFTAPVQQGQSYTVSVPSPPTNLTCIVRNGVGVVGMSNVSNVQVVCGFPIAGTVDLSVVNGITGQLPHFPLTIGDAIEPGMVSDPYMDSEQVTIGDMAPDAGPDAGPQTVSFHFQDPVPLGRICSLALTGTTSDSTSTCFIETVNACNGTAVTAPVSTVVRCNPVPSIALVPFPGATGSAYGVSANSTGAIVAGLEFTGTVNFGHGARVGSTFKSGTNKTIGSGAIVGLDANGYEGANATPASANWDQLIPTLAAKANQGAAKVRAVATNAAGDVIVGGSFIGSVDFGDGNGAFNAAAVESMFLARYSSAGALIWAHPFGAGAIASVAFNGSTIAVGGVFGTAGSSETFASKTGTGAAGCTALTAATAHRDFVAAFDFAEGGCAFSVNVGTGNDPNNLPNRLGPAVAIDSVGNVVAGGNALDANDATKLAGPYLIGYSSSGALKCMAGNAGNEIFKDPTTPANDQLNGIALGADDSIYFAGSCQGSPKVQGSTVMGCNTSAPSAFVAQLAPVAMCSGTSFTGTQSGAVLKQIASGDSSNALAVTTDATGNVYLAGNYTGSPALGGASPPTGSATLLQNLYFARLTSALATPLLLAINSTGSVTSTSIKPGAGGSAWVSGAYNGTVSTVTSTATLQLGKTAANTEPMLVQFPSAAP